MIENPSIIAFYGNKSGIGKSMAVLNTGYALAMSGRNVLIVDLDLKKPGLSQFLAHHHEYAQPAEQDILNLIAWIRDQAQHDDEKSASPGLDRFIVPPDLSQLHKLIPDIAEIGRLDLVIGDVKRNYEQRLSALELNAISNAERQRFAQILRRYLKDQRFYWGPEYYGDLVMPYDYILVDCPHGRPIAKHYLSTLADRVVICSDLNDNGADALSTFLRAQKISKIRQADDTPWDRDDPPPSRETPPRLGPKPSLIIATPVPAGEITVKKEALKRLSAKLGTVAVKLTYHPAMAFRNSIFVRDYPDEYLSRDYWKLTEAIMAMCNDHPTQLAAQAAFFWFRKNDIIAALQAALRIVSHSPSLGETLISFLKDNLIPNSEESFRLAEQLLRRLSHSAVDHEQRFFDWAVCLEIWSASTANPELAQLRRRAAIDAFSRMLQEPDIPANRAIDLRSHLAMLQMAGGDTDGAVDNFTRLADLTVNDSERHADALFNRGVVREEAGDLRGAIADFSLVIDNADAPASRRADARFNRSLLLDETGNIEAATKDWQTLLENPDITNEMKAQIYFNRGLSHKNASHFDLALEDWSRVIEQPDIPPNLLAKTFLTRGALRLTLRNWDEALQDFDAAATMTDVEKDILANAIFNRALVKLEKGDEKEAEQDLRKVIAMPGAPSELVADASLRLATREQLQGDNAGARADFIRAIEQGNPDDPQLMDAYFNLGVILQENGDYADAEKTWSQLLKRPDIPQTLQAETLLSRGLLRLETGHENALDDFNAVLEIADAPATTRAEALISRGTLARYQENTDEALSDLTEALELPELPLEQQLRARLARAITEGHAKKQDEANHDFKKILETPDCPTNLWAKTLLARAALNERDGKIDEAKADLKQVAEREGAGRRRVVACNRLAKLYLDAGDYTEAAATSQAGLDLVEGDVPELSLLLGLAQLHLKKTEEGVATLTKLIETAESPAAMQAVTAPIQQLLDKKPDLPGLVRLLDAAAKQREELEKNAK